MNLRGEFGGLQVARAPTPPGVLSELAKSLGDKDKLRAEFEARVAQAETTLRRAIDDRVDHLGAALRDEARLLGRDLRDETRRLCDQLRSELAAETARLRDELRRAVVDIEASLQRHRDSVAAELKPIAGSLTDHECRIAALEHRHGESQAPSTPAPPSPPSPHRSAKS